ncbi:MAG TPA: hypothetical protein VF593_00875 [Chthoniobacteraceae bacterium]|jgi:hypothetical protein
MPAEARVTPIWKKQKLFVAIFLIAVGCWFFYDGKFAWPKSNERWLAHDQFKKENRMAEWPSYAQSRGWEAKPPEKYHDRDALFMQLLLGTLAALGGAAMLIYWLIQKERMFRTDAEAVYTPAGHRVPFSAVTGLGLKKWESKGYAKVRYSADGRQREFLLDDYKYDRDQTHLILKEIEAHLLARTSTPDAPENAVGGS